MSGSSSGRRVLVTGASSGIGSAIVADGGLVTLLARSTDTLAEQADRLGDAAVAVPADVTDADALATAMRRGATPMGGLDAIVCSAGLVRSGGVATREPADWKAMFDVNVLGVLNTVHGALGHLRAADIAE